MPAQSSAARSALPFAQLVLLAPSHAPLRPDVACTPPRIRTAVTEGHRNVCNWAVQQSSGKVCFLRHDRQLRVDSDSSLASNAAVGRSTLRAGGCHLLDDWRASSFRVDRPPAPEILTGGFTQLLSFARPNSNVGSQSAPVLRPTTPIVSKWPTA